MWTAIFPIWARIAIIVGALATIFGIGYVHGRDNEEEKKDLELATLQHAFDVRIKTADDALIAANQRAASASTGAQADSTKVTDAYRKGVNDGTVAEKARTADYVAGRLRMRVDATCRAADPGSRRELPDAAAPAGGRDATGGPGTAELSPVAAGRVSELSEKVKKLVLQLDAAQALALSEHDRCNAVGNAPAPAAAPVEQPKPSRFKLGTPNPFDK